MAEAIFHDRLAEDGRNLVNALFSLWEFAPLRDPIMAGLAALDATVEDLRFPVDARGRMTASLAHAGGRETAFEALPDAVMAWLLRGAMLCAVSPAPLLVLDAAEDGLPAALTGPLAAMLRGAATRTQVVLTGVSPALDARLTEAFAGGDAPRLARREV